MTKDDKVIIVGGGHNGLVAAAYLAGAGLAVQVLERREMVGGAVVTEEWFPGYHLSTCAMLVHGLRKKVIDDLELPKYGYHVYPFDPVRVFPFPDGKAGRALVYARLGNDKEARQDVYRAVELGFDRGRLEGDIAELKIQR